MPAPAVVPRSPFVPRTAQPPYSHVANSTRAELDQLGLTALRAMVDVEPYGASELGGDPSDDEPPSFTSASPSDDDDPEDPDYRSGKKEEEEEEPTSPFSGCQSGCHAEDRGQPTGVHREGPIWVCGEFLGAS